MGVMLIVAEDEPLIVIEEVNEADSDVEGVKDKEVDGEVLVVIEGVNEVVGEMQTYVQLLN